MSRLHRVLTVIVALLVTVAPAYGQARAGGAPGAITVRVGERTVELARAELAKLPRRPVEVGEGGDVQRLSGVSLWDVLELAKAPGVQSFRTTFDMHAGFGDSSPFRSRH